MAAITELRRGRDTILHLAVLPGNRFGWDELRHINTNGTVIMSEAARRTRVSKVIYASSIHAAGGLPLDNTLGPALLTLSRQRTAKG